MDQVPTEYEDGEYDVLNHPDKSHSITPRARYESEGALKAAGMGIGRLGSTAGTHLIMRPKVEQVTLGVIQDYELVVHPDSTNMAKELNNYIYTDKGAQLACDMYNHSLDALRYGVLHLLANRGKIEIR